MFFLFHFLFHWLFLLVSLMWLMCSWEMLDVKDWNTSSKVVQVSKWSGNKHTHQGLEWTRGPGVPEGFGGVSTTENTVKTRWDPGKKKKGREQRCIKPTWLLNHLVD